jgi:predicted homoserine dehydrogenase-like protein
MDGDQPGVQMNLYRFVKGIGVTPVLCGNIRGMHDAYRNPTTQQAFAAKWGQQPQRVASFADGTKVSYEQAIVANGTGMRVARRGFIGPDFSGGNPDSPLVPLEKAIEAFADTLDPARPGLVDYVIGARPNPGVFVIGRHDDPRHQHYLRLYKLGNGPYYLFYTPYHLCHFEFPTSVARAVLFRDAVLAPAGPPRVGVIAVAKRAIAAGERLDGFGGYATYGVAIAKDEPIAMSDVRVPQGRTIDRLYAEQTRHFARRTVA